MPSKPVMVNTTGYLPLNYRQSKGFVVRIPFEKLAWSTCLLPLSSFVFCVIWSLLYNFDDSTFTHCKLSVELKVNYYCRGSAPSKYGRTRGGSGGTAPSK
ncbi:Post-GPI attachment to proteins factor 2 [Homalodisca vitripennis]|nr:Post-GPI attachment to proteins factor 2 [Homalodisca vitripennis]